MSEIKSIEQYYQCCALLEALVFKHAKSEETKKLIDLLTSLIEDWDQKQDLIRALTL